MTSTPSRPRSKSTIREKRRSFFLGILAKVIGCAAMVLVVASVFRVVMAKLWDLPPLPEAPEVAQVEPLPVPPVQPEPVQKPAEPVASTAPTPSVVPRAVPVPNPQTKAAPAELNLSVSGIEKIESKQGKITQAVAGFFTAKSLPEKLKWVRDPERVRPLMDTFYATHELRPQAVTGMGWMKSVAEPGYRFGYVQALHEGGESVSVIIEELSDGRVVVDWESSVRFGELSWKEFVQAKPERPTLMRVLASRPNLPIAAAVEGEVSQDLEVVLIKHPSDKASVEAVFDPSDPKLHPLVDQLQAGQWKDVPVTLRLCFPGAEIHSKTKLARITAVEGRGWLILPQKRS